MARCACYSRDLLTNVSNVLLDTGSAAILLPRSNCTTCGTHNTFDSDQSSTFENSPGTQLSFSFLTGADQFPLSEAAGGHGAIVTDAVSFAGLENPAQQWVLADVYASFLATMVPDGVMGLAPPSASDVGAPTSLFWYLYSIGQFESPKFSWFVNPGRISGAELTLGGVDETKYNGPITTVSLNETVSSKVGAWSLNQRSIFVSGKEVLNSTSEQPFSLSITTLDTGTAFMQPPSTQATEDLYAAISSEIYAIGDFGSWGAPCDVLDRVAVDVTFQIGPDGEFNATLPKEYFNLGPFPGQEELCEAAFVAPPGGKFYLGTTPVWIFGSPILKHYFTVWDGINNEVGFAKPRFL